MSQTTFDQRPTKVLWYLGSGVARALLAFLATLGVVSSQQVAQPQSYSDVIPYNS